MEKEIIQKIEKIEKMLEILLEGMKYCESCKVVYPPSKESDHQWCHYGDDL